MAKKRVHELAKQYDMPSSEVMKRLTAAGIAVKAAASAVDEDAADRALTGKPPLPTTNGDKPKPVAAPRPGQPIGPLGRGPLPPTPKPPAKPATPAGEDQSPRRPTRSSLQGERAPGAQSGVRRVVIDSQASRRPSGPGGGPGGPGGGPGGPGGGPGGQRRARGRGSRRARRQL